MNKNELNRLVAWRLKLLREADEMPRGVAQTCRHYGLSRNTFYKWKARYKSHGEWDVGLDAATGERLYDRSTRQFQQSLLSGSRISRHRSRQSARQRPQPLCRPPEDLREGRVHVHLLQLRQIRL
jgi:Helix-turn-helix domain